eukprot:3177174-Amphidinium_carterae.1
MSKEWRQLFAPPFSSDFYEARKEKLKEFEAKAADEAAVCRYCKLALLSKFHMPAHLKQCEAKRAEDSKPQKCQHCNKPFKSTKGLSIHLRSCKVLRASGQKAASLGSTIYAISAAPKTPQKRGSDDLMGNAATSIRRRLRGKTTVNEVTPLTLRCPLSLLTKRRRLVGKSPASALYPSSSPVDATASMTKRRRL